MMIRQRLTKGFSLVEILVSIFVIGLSVATYIPASVHSRQMFLHNRRSELATTVAGTILDNDRKGGYAALPLGISGLPGGITQPDLPSFTGSVTVTLIDKNMQPTATDVGRKRVDVSISWDDTVGDKGTIKDTTIIAND